MRQKVGIAIALAKRAKALLLDEPTSGLDPKAANEFSALLTRLRRDGVAVLMATHDLFRAKESGTRVGIMKHGRLLATRGTGDLPQCRHFSMQNDGVMAGPRIGLSRAPSNDMLRCAPRRHPVDITIRRRSCDSCHVRASRRLCSG
jgi:ABC-type multidrug transport system ATPase subunit